jgi:sugar phosphate isomerase/epimerase
MKTGIQLARYRRYYSTLEETLSVVKAHGYNCLDYNLSDTDDEIFQVSDAEFEKRLRHEGELIRASGLMCSQTHGPWRYPVRDFTVEDRAERYESMAKAVRGTAYVGAPNCVIHCIIPFGENNTEHRDELWEMNFEYFGRLCEVGKEYGVVINLENLPFTSLPLSRVCVTLEFVKQMNNPWMKMCLDTGHCTVYGDSVGDAVRAIGKEYLSTLHVHDNDGRGDNHWLPGQGVIEWSDFSKALGEIGFEGTVSLETGVSGDVAVAGRSGKQKALAALTRKIAEGKGL